MANDTTDPKDLIGQSFEIEGIGIMECRTIFLDWAMSLPDGMEVHCAVKRLLSRHQGKPRDHPMQTVLREALAAPTHPRRRGGWAGRRRGH